MASILIAIYYLVVVNLCTFGAFALDKAAAESGRWRISEATLLTLALVGGSLGALVGQRVMRHKTRKEPFRSLLIAIVLLQVGVLVALSYRSLQSA